MFRIQDLTNSNLGEWQREYLYKVEILSLPAGLTNLPDGFDINNFDLYCNAMSIPETKQKIIDLNWGGQKGRWSGPIDTSGDIEGTFRFDSQSRIYDVLDSWHQLSGRDESAAAVPKWLYVGSFKFTLIDVDKETFIKSWSIHNAWIPELSSLETDKTKEGLLTFKAKIAYDIRRKLLVP